MSSFGNMRSIFAVVFLFAHAAHKPAVDCTRLPDDTEPIGYELLVEPNFGAITPSFAGRVNISISVKTATDEITLNSRDLIVYEIGLTDDNTNSNIGIDSWKYAHHQEQNDVSDVFHSSYNSFSEAKERLAAYIQLHPMNARSAFPCYDEPQFKTPFDISIKIKRSKEIAFSNMPILNTADIDEPDVYESTKYNHWTFVNFIKTPPILTCMVKIFVGELEKLDKFHQNLINVIGLYLDKNITNGNPNELKAIRNKGFAASAIDSSSVEINPEVTDSSKTSYSATAETAEATTAPVTTDSLTTSYSATTETTEATTAPVTTDSSTTEITEPATAPVTTDSSTTEITEPATEPVTTDSLTTSYSATTETTEATTAPVTTDSSTTEITEPATAPVTTDSSTTEITEPATEPVTTDSSTTEITEPATEPIPTGSSTTTYSTTTEITEPAIDPVTTNSSSTEPATSTTQNSTETELTSTSEPFESTTDYITTTYNYPVMTKTIIFTSISNENSSFQWFYNRPYFVYNYIYIIVLIIFGLTISIVFLFVKPRGTNYNDVRISA